MEIPIFSLLFFKIPIKPYIKKIIEKNVVIKIILCSYKTTAWVIKFSIFYTSTVYMYNMFNNIKCCFWKSTSYVCSIFIGIVAQSSRLLYIYIYIYMHYSFNIGLFKHSVNCKLTYKHIWKPFCNFPHTNQINPQLASIILNFDSNIFLFATRN